MDQTMIFEFLAIVIGAAISIFLIPFIKNKIGNEKFNELIAFIEWCVRWAEQTYSPEQNLLKKDAVYKKVEAYAQKLGMTVTDEQLDIFIEGVVHAVKKG